MKHRRMTGSGLNAHMDEGAIRLQQQRTVRRCQHKIGQLMDELNEVAKQIATVMLAFPLKSREGDGLRELLVKLDVMLIDGDTVTGGLDDLLLAWQAKEFPHEQPE